MKNIIINLFTLILASCSMGVKAPQKGTTVAEGVLLSDTMRVLNFQQYRHKSDGCRQAVVEKVKRSSTNEDFTINRAGGILKGKISEVWTVNRCGKRIKYSVTYNPDGVGGCYISVKDISSK